MEICLSKYLHLTTIYGAILMGLLNGIYTFWFQCPVIPLAFAHAQGSSPEFEDGPCVESYEQEIQNVPFLSTMVEITCCLLSETCSKSMEHFSPLFELICIRV